MVARRGGRRTAHAASAFRPSAPAGESRAPSRLQTVAILLGVLVVAGGVAAASLLVKPSKARSFELFYGSMFLDDNSAPVSIDLASGKPSVRLNNAIAAVSATNTADVAVYPLDGGNTLMLDTATGEFNMVDSTGFLVKTVDGGVTLPRADTAGTATAYRSGDSAFIVRTGGGTTGVYLVGKPTVSSAVGASRTTKARAAGTIDSALAPQPVPAAAADGALWLLTAAGTGTGSYAVTELSVPAGSNAGATLVATRRGTVTGTSAVASATRNSDGTGGDVAAVASADSIQVFGTDGPTTHRVQVAGTVDEILPATNAQGDEVFLYRSSAGWSVVSVPTAGAGAASVTALGDIPAGSQLAVPAQSNGAIYTMDAADASLWRIEVGRAAKAEVVPGAPSYPFRTGESTVISGAGVSASGSRVVFNSRSSYEAQVLFTDGSRDPLVINKRAAVTVDPAGAAALADLPNTLTKPGKPSTTQPGRPKPTVKPRQPINNKINCKASQSVPHEPTLSIGDRAARSIVVTWTYPTLDPSDCIPTTYVVSVKVLTPGAPSTTGEVVVQGNTGVTLTGLFPATEYQIDVTAYLNQQHTSSLPARVSTGPEGPAAPTDVRASTDDAGNWTVSWNSCGGVAEGCVPTSTWYVLPSFCDGRGLSGLPDKVAVAGDPTVHSFSRVYVGGAALLGRGMCFRVQGVGTQGTVGDTSAPTPVAYSWSAPDAAALTLTASKVDSTALGATASTTLNLALGGDPLSAVGGVGARITFTLNTPSGPQTRTVTYDGRTSRLAATFTGITAGAQYTASASVAPPNHPGSAVTTPTVTVTTRANWPDLALAASCPPNGTVIVLSCTLTVRINGISSAQAQGELFSVVDGQLVCGSTGFAISKDDFDPATQTITQQVDLLAVNGPCTVRLALVEGARARDPKVFGGTTSGTVTANVDLGRASTLDATLTDFTAAWTTPAGGGSAAVVKYVGPKSDAQVDALTQAWQLTLLAPDGTTCGGSTATPTHGGVSFGVSPASCVNDFGDRNGWKVNVVYYDKSSTRSHTFAYTLNGTPPGYIPCTVTTTNFAAAWDAGGRSEVDFTFTTGGSDLRGCSNWDFYLRAADGTTCGHIGANRYDGTDFAIAVISTCDPNIGWTWLITYDDPAGTQHDLGRVPVLGIPPILVPPTTPPPTDPPDPTPTPTGS